MPIKAFQEKETDHIYVHQIYLFQVQGNTRPARLVLEPTCLSL